MRVLDFGPPGQASAREGAPSPALWALAQARSSPGPVFCNPSWPPTPVSLAIAGFLGCDLDNVFSLLNNHSGKRDSNSERAGFDCSTSFHKQHPLLTLPPSALAWHFQPSDAWGSPWAGDHGQGSWAVTADLRGLASQLWGPHCPVALEWSPVMCGLLREFPEHLLCAGHLPDASHHSRHGGLGGG